MGALVITNLWDPWKETIDRIAERYTIRWDEGTHADLREWGGTQLPEITFARNPNEWRLEDLGWRS